MVTVKDFIFGEIYGMNCIIKLQTKNLSYEPGRKSND
jgi:hypothetical protein